MAIVHTAGFVWDDPKLENIVMDERKNFLIIDFGISSPIGYVHDAYLRGSPGYTWSLQKSNIYDDFRKFAILIVHYCEYPELIEAFKVLDDEFAKLLQTQQIGNIESYQDLFLKVWITANMKKNINIHD